MKSDRSVLVLLGVRGGGDRQPVVALAFGLRDRGHRVTVLCDLPTEQLIRPAGLPTITVPPAFDQAAYLQPGFIIRWAKEFESSDGRLEDGASNPLVDWATAALPVGQEAVTRTKPDLIVGSLFCMGLADVLAASAGVPWCFVNPGFYIGDHSTRQLDADYYGSAIQRFVESCLLPLAKRADLVLHATDQEFDFQPSQLPPNHHYVGFLLCDPSYDRPEFLDQPGDSWTQLTVSTAPQREEFMLANSALQALAHQPVRTLLPLPEGHDAMALGDVPANVTLSWLCSTHPCLKTEFDSHQSCRSRNSE